MHTVELLEQTLELLKKLGYSIRQEWLGAAGGGGCEVLGRKIFFLDLALDPGEQLDATLATLRREPEVAKMTMPCELRDLLEMHKIG